MSKALLLPSPNAPVALRMGEINKLAETCGTIVLPADATLVEDLEKLITDSVAHLGGKLDFVLHSIGMSPNVRKGKPRPTSTMNGCRKPTIYLHFHSIKHCKRAKKLDALNEWGSVLTLSYIAAQKAFPGYGDMADAKATLESIVRSFGYYYGVDKKVRVNSISQSPTMTTAGSGIKGFDTFFGFADKMSPLGNASAEACADYCVAMFSDLTKYVTMQNLYHDGGFSNMGVSDAIMQLFPSGEE